MKVRLVEVNGKEDAYAANNTYASTIVTANVQDVKRVYMEEYTGIKCPWCVRGIEEISQNHTKFPGQFVAMATAAHLPSWSVRHIHTAQVGASREVLTTVAVQTVLTLPIKTNSM